MHEVKQLKSGEWVVLAPDGYELGRYTTKEGAMRGKESADEQAAEKD